MKVSQVVPVQVILEVEPVDEQRAAAEVVLHQEAILEDERLHAGDSHS